MSFPVAVQSAIFYVLACTPCMAARNRYRSKKRARREREARAEMEADSPPLYRHPSPFSQNPYWEEDIRMGPHLPKKGRSGANNKSSSQRKLASAGKDSSATRSSLAVSSNGVPNTADGAASNGTPPLPSGNTGIVITMPAAARIAAGTTGSTGLPDSSSHPASKPTSRDGNASHNNSSLGNVAGAGTNGAAQAPASPTLLPDDSHSMNMVEMTVTATTSTSEGWNYKRYQREDEELWGSELSRTHKLMDAIVKASSSAGRLLESRLNKERLVTEEERANFYAPTMIHPPVNEYHPPVVSTRPVHKDALRWMLQPPPPAKVMEGKVPVSRSTSIASSSASHGARRHPPPGSEVSLTRRMALEARLRRVNSNNSAFASDGRAVTPTSTGETVDGHNAGGEDGLGALGTSPSRSAPRMKSGRSKQRAALQSRNRSRSGSLTSSLEDPTWSSDDEAELNTQWRFPLFGSGSANASGPLPEGQSTQTTENREAANDVPKGRTRSNSRTTSAAHSTITAAVAIATVEARMANSQNQRYKLEPILSSDASSKAEAATSDKTKMDKGKENSPLDRASSVSEQHAPTVASTATTSDPKAEPTRSTSSIDSGLALSA